MNFVPKTLALIPPLVLFAIPNYIGNKGQEIKTGVVINFWLYLLLCILTYYCFYNLWQLWDVAPLETNRYSFLPIVTPF